MKFTTIKWITETYENHDVNNGSPFTVGNIATVINDDWRYLIKRLEFDAAVVTRITKIWISDEYERNKR